MRFDERKGETMDKTYTRESYLAEMEAAKGLPECERFHAYAKINDAINRQLFTDWDAQKARMVKIEDLPVGGCDLTYGELCRQQHIDWRSGAHIPCAENQG